jgi:hypothetical protein
MPAGLRHAAGLVADSGQSVARLRQQDGNRQLLGHVCKPTKFVKSIAIEPIMLKVAE